MTTWARYKAVIAGMDALQEQGDDQGVFDLEFLAHALEPFGGNKEWGTVPMMLTCPNCKHEWPGLYTPMPMTRIGMLALSFCPRCLCNVDITTRPPT